jgi:hypothetical protein
LRTENDHRIVLRLEREDALSAVGDGGVLEWFGPVFFDLPGIDEKERQRINEEANLEDDFLATTHGDAEGDRRWFGRREISFLGVRRVDVRSVAEGTFGSPGPVLYQRGILQPCACQILLVALAGGPAVEKIRESLDAATPDE